MASANSLLMIFYRNPVLGTVKTRLAATIGNVRALRIFTALATHTRDVTHTLDVTKVVFYSDEIDQGDLWPEDTYQKKIQHGADLGQRMENAFQWGFETGYHRICIVGTDCLELSGTIITSAFDSLVHADTVVGPAQDGGYYLLGMRSLHRKLFHDKQWSTPTVCDDTLDNLDSMGLSYIKLPVLRDVDTEGDLPEPWR